MRNPVAPRIAERRSLADARAWIERWPALVRAETIERAEALGRVAAEAVAAPRDLPSAVRWLDRDADFDLARVVGGRRV